MFHRRVVLLLSVVIVIGAAGGCGDSPNPIAPTGPLVTRVFPTSGPIDVSVNLQITGAGFVPGATASLGGVTLNVVFLTSTSLSVATPFHAAGIVNLVVTNPDGHSATLPNAFAYVPMSVRSIAPNVALAGTAVLVQIQGLAGNATIAFDGVTTPAFAGAGNALIVFPPAHAPGAVDVVVTSPSGQRATVTDGFTYQAMTLTASLSEVAPGAALSVSWVAPAGRDSFDWVGLFRVGGPNANYEQFWWEYTQGLSSGTKTLSAPLSPGQYEFRYFVEDGGIDAARSAVVTVISG